MKKLAIVYGGILAVLTVYLLISRKEDLFALDKLSFYIRPFRRAAVRLYKKLEIVRDRMARKGERSHQEKIIRDLRTLYPGNDSAARHMEFEVTKITNLMLFLYMAAFLALCTCLNAGSSDEEFMEGRIVREGYSGVTKRVSLSEENYGEFVVEVSPQEYTREEAEKLADEVFQLLPREMIRQDPTAGEESAAAENAGPENAEPEEDGVLTVFSSIHRPSSLKEYPFTIIWDSSRYAVIETNGAVHPPEEGEERVVLTAQLVYSGMRFSREYDVTVIPAERSAEEILRESIASALSGAEQESREESSFAPPAAVGDLVLTWSRKNKDYSMVLFLGGILAGVLAYFGADRDLNSRIEKRKRQMAMDYPQILSKLVLYVGAGMSVRNAFMKLGKGYVVSREQEGEKEPRYAYEEILLVCRELESGVSEGQAYSRFGRRCRMRQYSKLASLLSQNLRRGGGILLRSLEEEAQTAYEERRNLARQLGEEAGTKLLIPMVMMLAVTMVMIIIPVYMGMHI